ncbi:hypothetical protein [Actinoplanes sp. ATCC 53533]|uniref:hypothetical protein n=1 Tax=Actinoplanes sp. ATCC 53533 TaxID=1288362 RepID=UPI000F78A5AD|nr:hypothetical protein [Actinoplanes sp. ATCC 53533]
MQLRDPVAGPVAELPAGPAGPRLVSDGDFADVRVARLSTGQIEAAPRGLPEAPDQASVGTSDGLSAAGAKLTFQRGRSRSMMDVTADTRNMSRPPQYARLGRNARCPWWTGAG